MSNPAPVALESRVRSAVSAAFGGNVQLQMRRPNLAQLLVPAYMGDADGAFVYVEPTESGIQLTDVGMTLMRLSYEQDINERTHESLGKLARQHGVNYDEDTGSLTVPIADDGALVPAVFALVQASTAAESTVGEVRRRHVAEARFRDLVQKQFTDWFGDRCTFGVAGSDDPHHDYEVDALVRGTENIAVMWANNDLNALRCVSTRWRLDTSVADDNVYFWACVADDSTRLKASTQRRLRDAFPLTFDRKVHKEGRIRQDLARLAKM